MTRSTPPTGFDIYQRRVLRAYDFLVHGISNRWAWQCPTQRLVDLYREYIASDHLELGVGTGKFLAHPDIHPKLQQLAIADASQDCLDYAKARLKKCTSIEVNELHIDFNQVSSSSPGHYGSVGLNYVLHCLPSSAAKERAVDFALNALEPEGVLFGATLLGRPRSDRRITRQLETYYQRQGVFSNSDDSQESIEELLRDSFGNVSTELVGRALVFVATRN